MGELIISHVSFMWIIIMHDDSESWRYNMELIKLLINLIAPIIDHSLSAAAAVRSTFHTFSPFNRSS